MLEFEHNLSNARTECASNCPNYTFTICISVDKPRITDILALDFYERMAHVGCGTACDSLSDTDRYELCIRRYRHGGVPTSHARPLCLCVHVLAFAHIQTDRLSANVVCACARQYAPSGSKSQPVMKCVCFCFAARTSSD